MDVSKKTNLSNLHPNKIFQEYREKTRRSIIECTLKEGELLHQTQLRRIVSTYLVHYGYCATAEQFNKNAESVYADELNSMRNRQCKINRK